MSSERDDAIAKHVAGFHHHDEEVLSALFGPWKPASVGHVRDEAKGLKYQVANLYRHSINGGLPSKLKGSDRFVLWLAAALVAADRIAETMKAIL